MRTLQVLSVLTSIAPLWSGCAAEEQDHGDLVYSGPIGGLYRLGRRVEQVPSEDIIPAERPNYAGCGHLTERAEADIDRVLAELEPEAKYEIDVEACSRRWGSDALFTKIHIEGFTHSPFTCGPAWECCADDLVALSGLYDRVVAYATGDGEEHDEILEMAGIETYPMIEPDEPCRPSR
jgi:hypothetical protein